MRIALVAIFKNECEYILEWIAYHRRIIGITDIIIADNVSDDGTSQLLEALDQAGQIKRVFFPRRSETEGPQVPAYNNIIESYSADFDYFLFIDADEFLVNSTGLPLDDFLSSCELNNNFGAIALNWRVFGSSGNTYKNDGLVIERFYRASHKSETVNSHVKTLVAAKAVQKMHIHQADLKEGYVFLNELKEKATFLSHPSDSTPRPDNMTAPYTKDINNSLLYVAHFAVKSKNEHFIKKAGRGSAGGLASREKGIQYFTGHDLNQETCMDLHKHYETVEEEIRSIKRALKEKSPYYSYIRVNIDNRYDRLSGWVATDFEGPITIQCVLDSKIQLELPLNTQRKDVYSKGLSSIEKCGFNYPWADIGRYSKNMKAWIKGGNLVFLDININ
jgi:glycosyltransferase involved in cell wall biosynthesis